MNFQNGDKTAKLISRASKVMNIQYHNTYNYLLISAMVYLLQQVSESDPRLLVFLVAHVHEIKC